jgi:putative redox protein
MEASVVWDEGLSFTGAAESGFEVALGASREAGGDEDGFRPLELMLISLAGCTAMDVILILKKQRQAVTGLEVKVHAERAAEHPKVFTAIEVEYIVRGRDIKEAGLEKAIELSETRYCSAQAMLAKVVPIRHKYRIIAE